MDAIYECKSQKEMAKRLGCGTDKLRKFLNVNGLYELFCSVHNVPYKPQKLLPCVICGETKNTSSLRGCFYCKRHYNQMYRYGKIVESTIYDKNEIRDILTEEQIFELLEEFGGQPEHNSNNYIISDTICHNPPGEGSHKLYYYFNSKLFRCYTGGCEESVFDIFQLVITVMKIQNHTDFDLNDSIRWIANKFHINGRVENGEEDNQLEDWKYLANYDRIQDLEININNIVLKEYDSYILNNFNYDVKISIGNFPFPTKHYGDISLPSGFYDALKVEIGEAKGQNWWCVMFPELCFVDVSNGIVPESSKEELQSSLSDENYNLISSNDSEYKIKFKIVELFENSKIFTAKK